jgi:hypothetical protein
MKQDADCQADCNAWLACPFCGSANVGLPFDDRPCSWATCHDCGADGPLVKTPNNTEACIAWNRRQANVQGDRPLAAVLDDKAKSSHQT